MIVVTRFRVAESESASFRADAERALEALAAQRGHVSGRIGRNVDDPELWVLTPEWETVGANRRALSSYDATVAAVPTLSRAIDEPGAYEAVVPGVALNTQQMRSLG
jgi:quinol monooxygenase YgiN